VQAQGISVRDESGYARRFIATLTDISERREAEEKLHGERERLQLGQQAAGMIILDRDLANDRLTWSDSPEWLRGPLPASGEYPLFREQVHPEDRARFTEARDRAIATLQGGSVEFRVVRTDGKVLWVLSRQKVIADANGKAVRMLAAMIDITARRAQDEALRASVRLREEVERMSRHDLKTPLNSVIAVSRLLRQSATLSREDEELLSIVERAGYRILSMVNLSLDIFRMEQGTYQFRAQAVDLSEVARKVAADLESQAASKDVVINLKQSGHATGARRGAAVLLDARQPGEERHRGGARGRRGHGHGRGRGRRGLGARPQRRRDLAQGAAAFLREVRHHRQGRRRRPRRLLGAPDGARAGGRDHMHSDAQAGTTLSVRMRAAHAHAPGAAALGERTRPRRRPARAPSACRCCRRSRCWWWTTTSSTAWCSAACCPARR
jgi:signal transduction histidine kinase